MAFKEGVLIGTISFNATGSGTTAIAATSNTGTITIGNTSSGLVSYECGTAGIAVGTTANAHATTVGSTNTTSSTTIQSGSGALNVTSTNGALTVNSGTGALGLSTDATATTVSIATGGGVKSLTIGSTNTTSTTNIECGTGGANFGTSANAHTTTVGSTNTTSATTVQSGSGALNVTSTNGALTINSGTGAWSASNDASATTVNIATGAAAKTVQLGSTNTTSSLALRYGTSDMTLASATGTVMSALDTGEITYPLQPAFSAENSAIDSNVTGDGTIYTVICNTEFFDQGGDYNNATGVFTAPVTGRYTFTGGISFNDIDATHTSGNIRIATTAKTWITNEMQPFTVSATGVWRSTMTTPPSAMTAGDTASFQAQIAGGTLTVDVAATNTYYGGELEN